MIRKKLTAALAVVGTLGVMFSAVACNEDDADVASHNVSKAADNFEVNRRIVFFNGITDKYLLVIEGPCSIKKDNEDNQLEAICKTGPNSYKKHLLGLSDNTTYFVEQGESIKASAYHYRVTFKPQTILPDVDFRGSTSAGDLPKSQ